MTKQKDWKKKTRGTIRNWLGDAYPDGLSQNGLPYERALKETEKTVDNIMELFQQIRQERYDEGYKKGVKDEVECIETSGEHGKAVDKIREQARQEGIEMAERIIKDRKLYLHSDEWNDVDFVWNNLIEVILAKISELKKKEGRKNETQTKD